VHYTGSKTPSKREKNLVPESKSTSGKRKKSRLIRLYENESACISKSVYHTEKENFKTPTGRKSFQNLCLRREFDSEYRKICYFTMK
jgi:hypothetical protein